MSSSSRVRRWILAAVLVGVLLVGAGAGVLWWRHEDSFCTRVSNLPDALSSVGSSGSPAAGLLEYADALESLASVAPDAATAGAARTLATAQRTAGEALQGSTTGTSVVSAVGAAATADVTAAQSQLNASITAHCS